MENQEQIQQPTPGEFEELFDDKTQALFFTAWIANGRVAWRAYKQLFPNVTDGSARVLGAKLLTKINIPVVLSAYGLDLGLYVQILQEGLHADVNGVPDHKTRLSYLRILGELLGLSKQDSTQTPIQGFEYKDPSWFTDPTTIDYSAQHTPVI